MLLLTQMTFAGWLKHRVLPYREKLGKASLPILLLMDGHKTHCTEANLSFCYANHIIVVLPPAHTTRLLQPLDVGVFNIYKAKYRDRKATLKLEFLDHTKDPDGDREIKNAARTRCEIIGRSLYACEKGIDKSAITNAFKKTGIYPFSFDNFLAYAKDLQDTPASVKERIARGGYRATSRKEAVSRHMLGKRTKLPDAGEIADAKRLKL